MGVSRPISKCASYCLFFVVLGALLAPAYFRWRVVLASATSSGPGGFVCARTAYCFSAQEGSQTEEEVSYWRHQSLFEILTVSFVSLVFSQKTAFNSCDNRSFLFWSLSYLGFLVLSFAQACVWLLFIWRLFTLVKCKFSCWKIDWIFKTFFLPIILS